MNQKKNGDFHSSADDVFSESNLRDVFYDHIVNSAVRGLDGQQARQLLDSTPDFIQKLSSTLASNKPYAFTPYREILKAKGTYSFPRVISVPSVRDRLVLKAVSLHLNEKFSDRRPEIAPRKIHRISRAMEAGSFNGFIRLDIKNFYPSIPHYKLLKELLDCGVDSYMASIIASAIKNPTVPQGRRTFSGVPSRDDLSVGVPQGLSISNILAEIFMTQIDESARNIPNIWYERYVDDILVLCKRELLDSTEDLIVGRIGRNGLTVHAAGDSSKRDAGSIQKEFTYLGYTYKHDVVSARQSSVDSIYSSLARVFTQYRYALQRPRRGFEPGNHWRKRCQKVLIWRLCIHIEGCILNGQRRGWINYFSQISDMSLLGRLDAFVQSQLEINHVEPTFSSDITPGGVPKFKQAIWRTRYSESRKDSLIQNFDEMDTHQQKSILNTVFFYSHSRISVMDEADVNAHFRARIEGVAKELEYDLGNVY